MPRGRFIAFCGGEGAGKSTQIKLLAKQLADRREKIVITREPGGTPEGQQLRKLLLTSAAGSWNAMAETLLMVADRVLHVERVIRPALEAGVHVISDRFVLSTLSYQGAGRGVPSALIGELHRQTCADLWPDLTVILDIDPRLGLARSKSRLSASGSDETRFEELDLAFHQRVRAGFLDHAGRSGKPFVVVDASRPIADIEAELRPRIAAALGL